MSLWLKARCARVWEDDPALKPEADRSSFVTPKRALDGMMRVFDDKARTDSSRARETESIAAALNRIHTPHFAAVRELVECWFARVDERSQADLRGRLRSDVNGQFLGAFWELYLHETLLRGGYSVECHPDRATRSNRRPDFLARRPDGSSFYLEAVCPPPATDEANENRKNQILEAIQNVQSPNFYLHVALGRVGSGTPTTRKLRTDLTQWLASLDPDQVVREAAEEVRDYPRREWTHQGWCLTFVAIPRAEHMRGCPDVRTIGMTSGDIEVANDRLRFLNAVREKGGAYGALGAPYVVAVHTFFIGPDADDVTDALYGVSHVEAARTVDGTVYSRAVRRPTGYFFGAGGWQHQHVSAVLVGKDVSPLSVASNTPVLWKHPAASHPFDGLPNWASVQPREDGTLEFTAPRQSAHEWFNLPEEWPPGNPFDPYPGIC